MQVQGRIKQIFNKETVSDSFSKRELVVTTNEQYPQDILIQFTQDKCDLLNMYQIGQEVTVDVNLRGKEYTDRQTGKLRYFNTIQGWKINALQQQQQQQGGFQQTGGQSFNQNNGFNPNQQQQQFQQQGYVNNNQNR